MRWPPADLWSVTLGVMGFCAGFYGPIALAPGANQGPLLGIFVTGPAGLIGGMILGRIVLHLPLSTRWRWLALLGTNVAYLLGILYFCLPAPEPVGAFLEATVARCQPTSEVVPEGIAYWQDRIEGAPWMAVREGWRDELRALAAREPAVVLTLITERQDRQVRSVRPWNRGRISRQGWERRIERGRYLARFAGGDCASYPEKLPVLYTPYGAASQDWPPRDLAGLLHVLRLE